MRILLHPLLVFFRAPSSVPPISALLNSSFYRSLFNHAAFLLSSSHLILSVFFTYLTLSSFFHSFPRFFPHLLSFFSIAHVPLFFISSHIILSFPFSLFLAFLRIFLSHPFRFSSLFHPNLPSSFIPGPHTTSLVQPHPPPFLPQPLLPSYSFFPLSSFPIFLSPLSSHS